MVLVKVMMVVVMMVGMTMVLNGYDGDYIDGSDEVVMMIIVIIMIVADGNGW